MRIKNTKGPRRRSKKPKCECQNYIGRLPPEILNKIGKNINSWRMRRNRATCHYFKRVIDDEWFHKFKVDLYRYSILPDKPFEWSILTGIIQATWAYSLFGVKALFVVDVLHLLRTGNAKSLLPPIPSIQNALIKYFRICEYRSTSLVHFKVMSKITVLTKMDRN